MRTGDSTYINVPYIIQIRVRCKHNLTGQIGPPFWDTISCLLTDISCYPTAPSIMSKLVRNCEGSRAFAAFQKVNCRLKYARSWWSNCRRAVRVATTRRHLANLSQGRLPHRYSSALSLQVWSAMCLRGEYTRNFTLLSSHEYENNHLVPKGSAIKNFFQ